MPPAANASSALPLRPHPHLYEINTWVWLEKLSARYGRRTTLANIPDAEWDALAQQGYDIVWLMGVWQRSAISRQLDLDNQGAHGVFDQVLPGWEPDDVIGSPYSIVQYAPDPRIGVWLDIDIARQKLNARKMALFLDFVGNHTALDHPWTQSHPEYYVQGTIEDYQKNPHSFFKADTVSGTRYLAFGKDPYFPAWEDVAQLDHFQPQMRAAQLEDLKIIASHCDGVRCDMAMLQLNEIFGRIWQLYLGDAKPPAQEFWAEAQAAVPNLILLAEAYWGTEQLLIDLGFSFVYDKGFYDAVRDANVGDVRSRLSAPISYQSHLGRFLENHDEQCCAMEFGNERLPAIVTLMGSLPGLRFYLQGEPEGLTVHQPIELRRVAEQAPNPAIAKIFGKILKVTNEDVFHNAEWNLLSVNHEGDTPADGLIAYEWRSEKAWKLVVVNLSGSPSQGRIPLGESVSAEKQYMLYDELNDVHYPRDGKELHAIGLFVRRDPFQAHLFAVTSG